MSKRIGTGLSAIALSLAMAAVVSAPAAIAQNRSGQVAGMVGVEVAEHDTDPTIWFGVPLPGGTTDPDTSVLRSDPPQAPMMPVRDLSGTAEGGPTSEEIFSDLEAIIAFSRQSKARDGLLWGRMAGTPALTSTQAWVSREFAKAGLNDVETQSFESQQTLWRPTSVKLRLIAHEAYGANSKDVVLHSAFPSSGQPPLAEAAGELIFVGRGTEADLAGRDVRGKIAVLSVVNGSLVNARESGLPKILNDRGALAVISAVESPGNFQFIDRRYGCNPAACLIVGGDDGAFLEAVIGQAAQKHVSVRAELSVGSAQMPGGTSSNVLGIVPGQSDEIILINAHADGYFDGANDNADGLAVLMALARHYGAQTTKPGKTLLFLSSAGHHGPGYGPRAFIKDNPDLMKRVGLVINLEHLAQKHVAQRSRVDPRLDNYASGIWPSSTLERIATVGVVGAAPFVGEAITREAGRFGVPTYTSTNESVPGDIGEFARLKIPSLQLISAQVFYHSSGDTAQTISSEGLLRAFQFQRHLIDSLANEKRPFLP